MCHCVLKLDLFSLGHLSKPLISHNTGERIPHVVKKRSNEILINNDNTGKEQLPMATIEVFVVVDKYMVNFHGSESLQDYVLTMMNMVCNLRELVALRIKQASYWELIFIRSSGKGKKPLGTRNIYIYVT